MSEEAMLIIVLTLCVTIIACVDSCRGRQPDDTTRQAAEEAAR
jgi:hypothetical protein